MRSRIFFPILAAAALLVLAAALPSCKIWAPRAEGDQADVQVAPPAAEKIPPAPAAPLNPCPHAAGESGCPHAKEGAEHECPFHKEGAAKKPPPGAITCPIGGDVIEDVSKAPRSEYKGKTYYFGCEGCKAKFDADPEKYAGKAP